MHFDVSRNRLLQRLGCAGGNLHAVFSQFGLEFSVHRSHDGTVKLVNHGFGCFCRSQQAYPGGQDHVGKAAFNHGGYASKHCRALRAHHAQRCQLARLDVRQRLRHDGKHRVHRACQRVINSQCTAFVGHVQQLGLGARFKHQTRQVLRAAFARRGVGNAARRGLGGSYKSSHSWVFLFVGHHQHHWLVNQQRHRAEVSLGVIRQGLENAFVGCQKRRW